MTNAEKYLKDGIIYHNLACEIALYISNSLKGSLVQNIDDFFKRQANSTLTEDERTILRNIDKRYKYIGRTDYDAKIQYLYVNIEEGWKPHILEEFDHLFQFIKERRRVQYRGVIERRIKMTEEQAERIINKEHDKDLLKQEYYTFINNYGLNDCFENVVEFLDSCNLLKTKV